MNIRKIEIVYTFLKNTKSKLKKSKKKNVVKIEFKGLFSKIGF